MNHFYYVVTVLFLTSAHSESSDENKHAYLVAPWNTLFNGPSSVEKKIVESEQIVVKQSNQELNTLCYGCQRSSGSAKITISEIDLTALRIEYIKQQILKKLRLKEPPTSVMSLSELPKPLAEGDAIVPRSAHSPTPDPDDFYGKTTQAILFPIEDGNGCKPLTGNSSACFPFQLPNDIDPMDVSAAELWVYKERDELDSHNQTFVISEVAHWDSKQSFLRKKPMAIHETNIEEGWLRIDLAWSIRDWLHYEEYTHAINIACKTCAMDPLESPVSTKSEHRPFLVIYTYSHRRTAYYAATNLYQKRKKRHTNCVAGAKECCREELYVSFADIGWDDWIIFPKGYHAYFCRGSCSSAAAVTLSGSHYNSVIRKLIYQGVSDSLRLELLPCCTATQFLPLQLLYMDNNNTITQKSLPNMIVESCGCL